MGDNFPTASDCVFRQQDFHAFLKRLSAGSVDLILTDPPYAISRKTGFSKLGPNSVERFAVSMEFGKWDTAEIDLAKLSSAMFGALKQGGTAIVFYDVWKFNRLAEAMSSAGFKQLRLLIWDKINPVPLNSKRNYLTNSREVAVLGVKGGKPVFHGVYDKGVYRHPIPNNGNRFHPTQKPIELMVELIQKHSNAGDVVVDPFCGSGTTGIAAFETHRKFAGCDTDIMYVRMARKRLKDAMAKKKRRGKKSFADLFLELARPDKDGFSRSVGVEEFTGPYSVLRFGNGGGVVQA